VWFGKLGKRTKLFLLLLLAGSSFRERLFDRSASTPNAGELEELEYIVFTLVWDRFYEFVDGTKRGRLVPFLLYLPRLFSSTGECFVVRFFLSIEAFCRHDQ
jgi:hypothetical protein